MSSSRSSTPTPASRGALPTPAGSPAGTATTTTTTFTGEFRVPLRERVRLMRLSGEPAERPRTPIPGPSSPCATMPRTPRTPPHQATLPSVDECPEAPRKANKYRLLSHKKSSGSSEGEDEDDEDDDVDILLDRRANRLRASQLGMKLPERPQISIAGANERVKKAALGSAPARESPLRNSVSRDELTTLDILFFARLGLDSDDDASSSGGGSDWSISGESSSVGSKTSEDGCQSSGDELLAPGPIKPIAVDLEALETQATSQK
ncbi:hypothetical protein F4809DRAFT_139587 [Biscogniauxia mediterranea]|nr:hypothetical protein F4809DRAFT_139587 [Biscogniauxia mediterranea]